MAPSSTARCPRAARQRISSSLSTLCRKHLGRPPGSSHPCAADLVWRFSGGRLGKALEGCRRTVLEAAAQGVSSVRLEDVVGRGFSAFDRIDLDGDRDDRRTPAPSTGAVMTRWGA